MCFCPWVWKCVRVREVRMKGEENVSVRIYDWLNLQKPEVWIIHMLAGSNSSGCLLVRSWIWVLPPAARAEIQPQRLHTGRNTLTSAQICLYLGESKSMPRYSIIIIIIKEKILYKNKMYVFFKTINFYYYWDYFYEFILYII